MIHISLECLWKLPQPNIYLLRFTATPPELIQRGWQRIIYMLMPLFYDFFFFVSSLVLGATEWFETDFVNEEKEEEERSASSAVISG